MVFLLKSIYILRGVDRLPIRTFYTFPLHSQGIRLPTEPVRVLPNLFSSLPPIFYDFGPSLI